MRTLTPPIKYHGGKHYLADWILSHAPKHTHYVEPFFGGGAVLLRKNPEGVSEVVNDLNRELTVFWQVLSRDHQFAKFKRVVEATPFSEHEFDAAVRKSVQLAGLFDDRLPGSVDTIQRAVRFFIQARQSRQGLMKDFATLSRNRTRRGMNEQASSWLTAIDGLADVHERMKRVVILNRPACEVIRQQDGPNTFFYCDPPYLHETRVTTGDYAHEMTPEDHQELLATLAEIKGKFILSGYPNKGYDIIAELHGWHRVERSIDNKASSAKTKAIKTEVLWMNFEPEASP